MDAQTRSALKKDDIFIHSTQAGLDWIAENRAKTLRIAIAVLVAIAVVVAAVIIYQQRSETAANAFGRAAAVYATPIADASPADAARGKDLSHRRGSRQGCQPAFAEMLQNATAARQPDTMRCTLLG